METQPMRNLLPGRILLIIWGTSLSLGLAVALLYAGAEASPRDQQGSSPRAASIPVAHLPCVNGSAGPYPCESVDFLSQMTIAALGGISTTEGANVWGWTDPISGTEYVLMGLTDSTAFINISDPENPALIGSLPTETNPSVKYRDIKVYQDYAYIIADFDSNHGMQVFDLTQLRGSLSPTVTFTATAHYTGFEDAHNIFINKESGFAYVLRTTNDAEPHPCDGAVYMVALQDPENPAFAGCFTGGGLASDTICVNYHGQDLDYLGREICVVASDDNVIIADVTDKSSPTQLKQLTYTDIARAHNAWVTEDHRYFLTADMNDEIESGLNTRIFIWHFNDVDNPTLAGIYNGPTSASDHNVWVAGQQAYIGNFRAGVRILDLFDIGSGSLTEAAYFDLVPGDDNAGHSAGAWAVYPYFESGIIAVSDKVEGLFLLRPHLKAPALWLPAVHKSAP
jgi:choice-of-anchor B domain-containing protein